MNTLLEKINSTVKDYRNLVSIYFELENDSIVRIANHLPKKKNLLNNNEDLENLFLIFVNCEVYNITIEEVEKYIDTELSSYNVDFAIVNEFEGLNEYDLEMLKRCVNN